ncbi:MAG TPA: hypothetical protein PKM25_05835, partial [Candidatus Ozemobacteraceae bacterium]|nr:hypothetical protein [Candidatus Ozemobacteraceae bacterium]
TITVTTPGNTTPQIVTLIPTRPVAVLGGVSGSATKAKKYDPAETGSVELFLATGTARFHAMSDSAGAFSFTNIPVGTYTLECANPAYSFTSPVTVLVASPTNAISTPFVLQPTMSILGGLTGQVVRSQLIDAEPSMDLIHLKIATGTPGSPNYFEMLTVADENGYFTLAGVPIGTYSVFCSDLDYVFSVPTTVQAGKPIINNGVLTLVPNPSVKGTGVLVGTITTSLTTPTRVVLVSQVSPANNRETYAVQLVPGSLSFRVSGILPGNYALHLDQETGLDIDPMGPTNIVNITQNTVTQMTFSTLSILPTITALSTSPTDITVTGVNLNPNYRIEVSHLGQEPWAQIPSFSFLAPNLAGNPNALLGGRYMVRVAIPNSSLLIATWPTEVLLPPDPIQTATPVARADSITVNWPPVPGISQYRALIRTSAPSTFARTVNTTTPSVVFSGLEPATSYNIDIYSIVDDVPSFAFPLLNVMTQGVQMAPQALSFKYSLQGGLIPDKLVASGGVLYFLEGFTSPQYLSSLDTTTGASQSVMLGSVMSTSKIFSGSAGLYVIQQESLNQVIQQYDPANLTPKPFSYTAPADSNLMQATYCAATNRIYCVRANTSLIPYLATMTVLMPDLTPDGPETAMTLPGMPMNMKVEASRDGTTVGVAYDFTSDGTSGTVVQGYFTSSRTFAAPVTNGYSLVSLQGGPNGSLFVFWNNAGDYYAFNELKPTLNKQFVINSERQYSSSTRIQLDGNLNRWIEDGMVITAFDPVYSPLRAFNLLMPPDIICHDPVAGKILCISSSGSTIDIDRLDADF